MGAIGTVLLTSTSLPPYCCHHHWRASTPFSHQVFFCSIWQQQGGGAGATAVQWLICPSPLSLLTQWNGSGSNAQCCSSCSPLPPSHRIYRRVSQITMPAFLDPPLQHCQTGHKSEDISKGGRRGNGSTAAQEKQQQVAQRGEE